MRFLGKVAIAAVAASAALLATGSAKAETMTLDTSNVVNAGTAMPAYLSTVINGTDPTNSSISWTATIESAVYTAANFESDYVSLTSPLVGVISPTDYVFAYLVNVTATSNTSGVEQITLPVDGTGAAGEGTPDSAGYVADGGRAPTTFEPSLGAVDFSYAPPILAVAAGEYTDVLFYTSPTDDITTDDAFLQDRAQGSGTVLVANIPAGASTPTPMASFGGLALLGALGAFKVRRAKLA